MANRPKKMTFKIITKTQIKVSAPSLYPEAMLLRQNYAELGQGGLFHTLQVCEQASFGGESSSTKAWRIFRPFD